MRPSTAGRPGTGRASGGGSGKAGSSGSNKVVGPPPLATVIAAAAASSSSTASGTSTAATAPALTYSVEDTSDGSYRDVGAYLTRRYGWTSAPYRRPQKGAGLGNTRYVYIFALNT